ncbi:hypothetical protein RISK_003580 [Rhodopirellula islandica]|uniref:Uncharacterized protein n=1 Tax=Rhodopirellula islandica TaxID=595434 RepID=A0A0J1BDF6_RHOIS|nr:hypothetical protein RISK_003580 [Rhodopirellula islandica]
MGSATTTVDVVDFDPELVGSGWGLAAGEPDSSAGVEDIKRPETATEAIGIANESQKSL